MLVEGKNKRIFEPSSAMTYTGQERQWIQSMSVGSRGQEHSTAKTDFKAPPASSVQEAE